MSKKELFRYLDAKCVHILDSISAFENCGRDVKGLWYVYDVIQNLITEIDGNFGKTRIRSKV